jgi:hypothetical protein
MSIHLLYQAFRVILLGPSAINGKGKSGHGTKRGNVQLNVIKVTIPSVSYVATLVSWPFMLLCLVSPCSQVYFGPAQQSMFCTGGDLGCFDFNRFYRGIIKLICHEAMDSRCNELLSWWKRYVRFSIYIHICSSCYSQAFPNLIHTGNAAPEGTVHARMMAQMVPQVNV